MLPHSQWLDISRPFPLLRSRLDTAAGPSRNHTGVPCLPVKSRCNRRATRFRERAYGLRRCPSSVRVLARTIGRLSSPHEAARKAATITPKIRVNLYWLENTKPYRLRRQNARHFLPNAHRKSFLKKYLGLAQAPLIHRPIALFVPRGITVPVGQPGGGSNLKITRVTEWLDRPVAEKVSGSRTRGD